MLVRTHAFIVYQRAGRARRIRLRM